MANLNTIGAKLSKALSLLSAVLVVPVFLAAGFLFFFAPIPQLIIHVHWSWAKLGLPGKMVLLLGMLGVIGLVLGFLRKRPVLHRAGILLFIAPIIGVAFQRVIIMSEWLEISLLGAFLFTV